MVYLYHLWEWWWLGDGGFMALSCHVLSTLVGVTLRFFGKKFFHHLMLPVNWMAPFLRCTETGPWKSSPDTSGAVAPPKNGSQMQPIFGWFLMWEIWSSSAAWEIQLKMKKLTVEKNILWIYVAFGRSNPCQLILGTAGIDKNTDHVAWWGRKIASTDLPKRVGVNTCRMPGMPSASFFGYSAHTHNWAVSVQVSMTSPCINTWRMLGRVTPGPG